MLYPVPEGLLDQTTGSLRSFHLMNAGESCWIIGGMHRRTVGLYAWYVGPCALILGHFSTQFWLGADRLSPVEQMARLCEHIVLTDRIAHPVKSYHEGHSIIWTLSPMWAEREEPVWQR